MKLQSTGMFAAATIWGTWVLVLSGISLPGYFVTAITSFTGFLALLIYVFATKNQTSFAAIIRNPKLLRLTALVAFLEAVQNALLMVAFMLAISGGGSVFIPIIRSLTGVVAPLAAGVVARKEFSVRYLLYGVVATAGAILIFGAGGLEAGGRISYLALGLVGLSVVVLAIEYIVQRFLALEIVASGQQTTNVVTYQALLASLFLTPLIIYYFSTPAGTVHGLGSQVAFISIFGITHVALALVLRLNALKHMTAQQGVVIGYLEPVTSITLSILFLNESISTGYVIGSLLVLGSAIAAGLRTVKLSTKGPSPHPQITSLAAEPE